MTPRKIFVLGASGGTGRQFVAQALDAGHEVTVLVRDASKAPAPAPRLQVATGDVLVGAEAIAVALRGHDAVVSALGRGQSLKAEGLIARAAPIVVEAMRREGIRRLVFTSAIGVGDSIADAPLIPKIFFRSLLRDIYADKAAGEDAVRKSGLDWTILQPAQLTDGPYTGRYRSGPALRHSGIPKISRADAAHCLLMLLDDATSVGKIVRAGYR